MQQESTSSSLVKQVRHLAVGPQQLAMWALGQHGFVLKGANKVVVIDPYLSNPADESSDDPSGASGRQVPIVVEPRDLNMVDVLLITHHHGDHCDPQTVRALLAASPDVQIMTSWKARAELASAGIKTAQITVPPVDRQMDVGEDIQIIPVPAAHYEHEPDEAGNPAYLGFIIMLNGVTLYHSGDTVIYPGMAERLAGRHIDLACLPVNGRDWFREQQGVVGNMDYREAADLTARIGARVLIPAHNDMFRGNRVNPAYLMDYLTARYPRQRVHFLQAGELYYYVA